MFDLVILLIIIVSTLIPLAILLFAIYQIIIGIRYDSKAYKVLSKNNKIIENNKLNNKVREVLGLLAVISGYILAKEGYGISVFIPIIIVYLFISLILIRNKS